MKQLMGLLWVFCGSVIGLLWVCRGSVVGLLWVCRSVVSLWGQCQLTGVCPRVAGGTTGEPRATVPTDAASE